MRIDRCLCFGVPFATLADVAETTGAATVPELQRHVTFGRKCRLCHPYVRRTLRTGQTVFREVVTEADEPAAGAGRSEPRPAETDRPPAADGGCRPRGEAVGGR